MDAETFKRSFLPFHRKLYFVAFRLLENEADAEDLVQEAYLKMWNKRDSLTAIGNPEAFIVKLVKNMCYDILRSGKSVLNRQTVGIEQINETVHSDAFEACDELQLIKTIISELPDKQQRVVILRDVKECTYEEIEEITGLSSVNIRVLLSRARKRIRGEYKKYSNYGIREN
jgi:RNA polymerase sigma factor, sigma-70 family